MEGQIKVIFTEGSSKNSGNNRTSINTKTGATKSQEEIEKQTTTASSLANHAINALVISTAKKVVGIALNEALYEVNKYFTLTDNVEAKRDLNIALGLIRRSGRLAKTTLAGAIQGGIPGAVIGFGLGFAGEVVSVYQGYDQQNIQIRQLETQLEYTRERAGYSLTSGSIGENK